MQLVRCLVILYPDLINVKKCKDKSNNKMNFKKNLLTASVLASVMTLTACGGSSSSDPVVVDPVEPTNSAPTDIALSNMSVDENSVAGEVGTLSATDADSGDTFTFTTDSDRFSIDGTTLSLAEGVSFDFETEDSVTVSITVADAAGATFSKDLTIDVNDLLDTYKFASKFNDGESSVSYTGQIARHAMIAELNHYIGNVLKDELDDGTLTSRDEVLAKLDYYFRTTEEQYDGFALNFLDNAEQGFVANISSSHKNLVGKIAGNDVAGQDKDWSTEFAGWAAKGAMVPEDLVDVFFGQLADNAQAHIDGVVRTAVTGEDITEIYLNTDGTDLKQLIQKYLLMAVPYSQSAGDYLGTDYDGKGLTTDNISADGGTKPYSKLEHQFDEGFGYFGAAVNYLAYNDNEISGKVSSDEDGRADWNGYHDTDGNGTIDLTSEYNWGQSVNAAKRDRGTASNTNPTDLTKTTMEAFLAGRKIINDNAGMALSEDQMTELLAQRDIAIDGWERAIAATVVHYINDTNADLQQLGTDDFNYADLAKHFSEMKGFALGLQFSPFSKITDEQFEQIHTLMGNAPVLNQADVAAYMEDLLEARDIIETALSFDSENVANW